MSGALCLPCGGAVCSSHSQLRHSGFSLRALPLNLHPRPHYAALYFHVCALKTVGIHWQAFGCNDHDKGMDVSLPGWTSQMQGPSPIAEVHMSHNKFTGHEIMQTYLLFTAMITVVKATKFVVLGISKYVLTQSWWARNSVQINANNRTWILDPTVSLLTVASKEILEI